jgi:ABC-2 type transport system permease protein
LIYRGDFFADFISFLTGIASNLLYLYFIFKAAGGKFGEVWSPEQVVFIWGMALVPNGLFNVVAGSIFSFPEKHINQGHFDRVLLRPLPALPQVFMENFRFGALIEVLTGIAVMTLAGSQNPTFLKLLGVTDPQFMWAWNLEHAALFTIFAICGALIIICIFIMVISISFFSQDRLGVGAPIWNMMTFGRWPIAVFPGFIQFVLIWVLPFACVGFLPATVLMDVEVVNDFLPIQAVFFIPLMTLLFITLAGTVWRLGIRNYTSVGA